MNSIKYSVVRASGKIETIHVPSIFSPYEVAARLRHDLVFMHVRKGFSVIADSSMNRDSLTVYGPAVVLVYNDKTYEMPQAPKDDHDAYRLWKTYGPAEARA